jgi:two-component system, OmpR family, alkaline phosphatase synthesis response regulator PhoP
MPKILIADDELVMRDLLKEALEKLEDKGVEILTVDNGNEAIDSIRTEKPEFVILDIMMPGRNGFEVCNIVKNELGIKDVFVLILTASTQGFDKQMGKDVGADIYMTKPFDPDEITKEASKALEIKYKK